MKGKVLITGGSGLTGQRLSILLAEAGWKVALLSRSTPGDKSAPGEKSRPKNEHIPAAGQALPNNHDLSTEPVHVFHWNPMKAEVDPQALEYAEHVIHLAGTSIGGGRWTPSRKKKILDSRVRSLDTLREALAEKGTRPLTLVSASAVGYYGTTTSSGSMEEEDPAGSDFTATVCRIWEGTAADFLDLGTRVAVLRTGLVLSDRGGALPRLARPARLGLAAPLASGQQAFPWIHLDDLCRIYIHILENKTLEGPFNAVAPARVNNREFTGALARHMGKPAWLPPIPRFFLRLVLGEMSVLLTEGSHVSPARIQKSGFEFRYPDLQSCLASLYPQ